jgi:16S rRNA (adenine1518-N6/adenine1519-N6)-dimethyltransferase
MGVLTKYLLDKPITTYVIEIDTESVDYLDANYPKLKDKIISKIFFVMILMKSFKESSFVEISVQHINSNCFKTLEKTSNS